jgi:hypothetical protein
MQASDIGSNGLVGDAAAAPARTCTDRGNAALATTQAAPTIS